MELVRDGQRFNKSGSMLSSKKENYRGCPSWAHSKRAADLIGESDKASSDLENNSR